MKIQVKQKEKNWFDNDNNIDFDLIKSNQLVPSGPKSGY